MNTANSLFSTKTRAEMDRNIAKYPPEQKQSAVMACLIAAQEEHGWVSPAIIAEVAGILDMPTVQTAHAEAPCFAWVFSPSKRASILSWLIKLHIR